MDGDKFLILEKFGRCRQVGILLVISLMVCAYDGSPTLSYSGDHNADNRTIPDLSGYVYPSTFLNSPDLSNIQYTCGS
jgi:hypothetical protein